MVTEVKLSHSVIGWFSTDFKESKPPVNIFYLRAGCRSLSQTRLFATQAGRRADSPRENPFVGVGPPARPAPPGTEPWPAPAPAPGPQVFPGHSASAGVGHLPGSVVPGKTGGAPCERASVHFHGQRPRDPVNLA